MAARRSVVPTETAYGDRLIRTMMSGDAPREPQMTSTSEKRAMLVGATPNRASFDPGRQVDPLGRQFELTWFPLQRRTIGRDERAMAAMRTVRDLDPQAAQAVWNFMRLANPGMEVTAMVGEGIAEKSEQGPAQAYLDALMTRVGAEYGGGGDQMHNVLTLCLVTDGAVAAEVAPTEDLDDVIDWYPIEPILIAFKRDPKTHGLIMGQRYRDGTWNELNEEQVFYVPLDPDVEDPYGRPPMLSAVSAVMAKAQMLNDVRAAAHTAGYPKIDVEVLWTAMTSNAPPDLRTPGREKDLALWAEQQLDRLVKEYESMQVDDTFVHYDWVTIKTVEQRGSGFRFDLLDAILTRQVNSALKTLPILLGINEATSESHGSVQWNIQVAAVEALQRIVKRVLEKLANVSLQVAGFAAHTRVKYNTIRTIDRLTEAQAETFEFTNLRTSVSMGWRSNDEAAQLATDHAAVSDPLPGAFGPGVGLSDQPATPGSAENAQSKLSAQPGRKGASDQAWKLLAESQAAVAATADVIRQPLGQMRAKLTTDWLQATSESYRAKARGIYDDFGLILVEQLEAEGVIAEWAEAQRTFARDASDSVFGLGYRREMKGLLRDSIAEGMRRAGSPIGSSVAERVVRRIWQDNKQYVDRIAADLRDAINAGVFQSVADVKAWLDANAYREEMMGEYLSKQGLSAGYVDYTESSTGASLWTWTLGSAERHCQDCLEREGNAYTYDELLSLGFPGSGSTECMSQCQCSVDQAAAPAPAGAMEAA